MATKRASGGKKSKSKAKGGAKKGGKSSKRK
jgi:hypothetical protein